VLIPAAYLLSLSGKVNLIWWAFPIAELVSLILATLFLLKVLKKAFPKEMKTA
jgi:Na+-driven multidrug efflux pump